MPLHDLRQPELDAVKGELIAEQDEADGVDTPVA